MKNRKLQLFLIMAAMAGCLLSGCGNTGEAQLPEKKETAASVTESAGREGLPAEKENGSVKNTQFSFADISNLEFWFGSGAGAWRTVLTVRADGTFEGEYRDSDMGDRGDGYPHGVCYLCNFTGKFAAPEKVNDNTYTTKIEHIELAEEPAREEIVDEIKYIYSDPYGLEDAGEIRFYLPGTPIEELPEEYKSWTKGYDRVPGTKLPFYGLYNVNTGAGFSSYEKAGMAPIDDELAGVGQQEALTAEEREWIAYKEAEIKEAGAQYEGGTMQPLVENEKGAELTKARVYELVEYLR